MLQDPDTIEPALDLILISRHLERIGDHATNVAEDVIFIVSARDVRHQRLRPGRPRTAGRSDTRRSGASIAMTAGHETGASMNSSIGPGAGIQ